MVSQHHGGSLGCVSLVLVLCFYGGKMFCVVFLGVNSLNVGL